MRALVLLSFFLLVTPLPDVGPGALAQAGERGLLRNDAASRFQIFDADANYAVVVGINEYDHFGALHHAVDDANRLESLLLAQGYTVRKLTDYKANPERILKALDMVARLATDGGRTSQGSVVFAFAGHGFQEEGENYLATSETVPHERVQSSLSVTRVKRLLEDSGVRQRILFLDACRNVPGSRVSSAEDAGFELDDDPEGSAVFYSTGKHSLAYEDPQLRQGVFTHFLAKGLEGEAVDGDGAITFDGLRRYVEKKVKNHVYLRFNQEQVPYISGERTGDFVLARLAPNPAAAAQSDLVPVPEAVQLPDAEPAPAALADAAELASPSSEVGDSQLAMVEAPPEPSQYHRRMEELDGVLFSIDAELDALRRDTAPRGDTVDKVLAYATMHGHSAQERNERIFRLRLLFEAAIRHRIATGDLARVPEALRNLSRLPGGEARAAPLREDHEQAALELEFAAIDEDIASLRITRPAGRNALDKLVALQKTGVSERDILERYRAINLTLVQRIRGGIRTRDFDLAEAMIDELESVPGQFLAVQQAKRALATARARP